MDPLSISASIIALAQAAAALGQGYQAAKRFANAGAEFAALSNEVGMAAWLGSLFGCCVLRSHSFLGSLRLSNL
jgi:hypothetical protein